MNIGITGQAGFVGTHLFNYLNLDKQRCTLIPFEDRYFSDERTLDEWVKQCDTIVHLAAMNRHNDPDVLYRTNIDLIQKLLNALDRTGSVPHLLFSSSSQESRDNLYGKSKREGRMMLSEWAAKKNAPFTGLVIPNVFGPFGHPNYNSVIATFSHQLSHGLSPVIEIDGDLQLIYVGDLVAFMKECIIRRENGPETKVPSSAQKKVSELLRLLNYYKESYCDVGKIPAIGNAFERQLFNTFRSYIDLENMFPFRLKKNEDARGVFVETLRTEIGGQVSFSSTKPGITRGNHFHTRKIERFTVIQGEALISMRKIGTEKVLKFTVSGNEPSFVDMPVWYTHNITNVGNSELLTIFWIDEWYDPNDPDTYVEQVENL